MGLLKKIWDTLFFTRHHIPSNPYNPHAWIIDDPKIDKNCWIGPFTIIDGSGGLEIGEGTTISSGVHVYSHSAVRRNISNRVYPKIDKKPVKIGKFCHIGPNSTILMGVSIGDNVVVGAGSVILEDTNIPDYAVVAGNPIKTIHENSDHLWKK
ncbi:MAG: acyltransferase [bacterium]|nr:acyltransferase [bacterium]